MLLGAAMVCAATQVSAFGDLSQEMAAAAASSYEAYAKRSAEETRRYNLGSYNFPRSSQRKDAVMERRVHRIVAERQRRLVRKLGIAAAILFGTPLALSAIAWAWTFALMSVTG